MEIFPHVNDMEFWTVIKVLNKDRTVLEWKSWSLPFELAIKYKWYFKYRHALLQIKYPKLEVITYEGKTIKKEPELQKNIDNKIRAAKAKVSELKNKLARAKLFAQNELFGIDNEPIVIEFKKRISDREKDLEELQNMSVKDFYLKFKDRYPDVDVNKI